YLDESHIESGVLVAGEGKRAGDMDGANQLLRLQIVGDRVTGTNLDPGTGAGNLAPLPGGRRRPGTTAQAVEPGRGRLLARGFCGRPWQHGAASAGSKHPNG